MRYWRPIDRFRLSCVVAFVLIGTGRIHANPCSQTEIRSLIYAVQDRWIYKTVVSEATRRNPELMQTVAALEAQATAMVRQVGEGKIANSLLDPLQESLGRRLRGTARDLIVTESVIVVLEKIAAKPDVPVSEKAFILEEARDVLGGRGEVRRWLNSVVRKQALDYLNDSVTNTHPLEREALGTLGAFND